MKMKGWGDQLNGVRGGKQDYSVTIVYYTFTTGNSDSPAQTFHNDVTCEQLAARNLVHVYSA